MELKDKLTHSIVVKRHKPINLKESDEKLFNHEYLINIGAAYLKEFKNVRLSKEGIIFKGLKVLPESFPGLIVPSFYRCKLTFLYWYLKKILLYKKKIKQDKYIWATDLWSNSYFHWLTDCLTRLEALPDKYRSGYPLLLPEKYSKLEYVNESLEYFGLREIEFISNNYFFKVDRLVVATETAPTGNYNPELILNLRNRFRQALMNRQNPIRHTRIYISRSKAKVRKVRNESELESILEDQDFLKVSFEDFSWLDQVSICMNASVMIGIHGAGLTNMIFMNQGSRIGEIRHNRDSQNNCYFSLASALNFDYYYLLAEPKIPDINNYNTSDLMVDIKGFEAFVKAISS